MTLYPFLATLTRKAKELGQKAENGKAEDGRRKWK